MEVTRSNAKKRQMNQYSPLIPITSQQSPAVRGVSERHHTHQLTTAASHMQAHIHASMGHRPQPVV